MEPEHQEQGHSDANVLSDEVVAWVSPPSVERSS